MDKYETLKHYFGHETFRPGQEPLIDGLLQGRDVFGIMPTGAGKSMCYQVPAMMLPGITLVISPLISLMKDQVAALKEAGIPAAYLNSSLTSSQISLAMQRAAQGAYRIIYVAPERLDTPSFLRFSQNAKIALIAVDEAHCVSQWGQDFRPNYLRIADFVRQLPKRPPIGAFTATATEQVKQDIIRLLQLLDPVTTTTGFDRPNLFFEVCQPKSKYEALRTILRSKRGLSGIVYCATRKNVEEVTDKLIMDGFPAGRYHAGLSDEERKLNQEDFQYDRVSIMVATNAFGMGIDKSNVSFVIHYNMPKSMEAYYQEAGRAGRDGSDAECILLYSGQDIITGKWMIEHSEPNADLTKEEQNLLHRRDLKRLNDMASYCTKSTCLRAGILRYFGEKAPEHCGTCSRCTGGHYPQINGMERVKVTAADRQAANAMPTAGKSLLGKSTAIDPDGLFAALRNMRTELSRIHHLPPYIVCSDKTLSSMEVIRPHSYDELLSVYGMGESKAERYGRDFLRAITEWEQTHPEAQRRATAKQQPRFSTPQRSPAASSSKQWPKSRSEDLRRRYLSGESMDELALFYGCTVQQVREQLVYMRLVMQTTPTEAYGMAAYWNEYDDPDRE